MCEPEITTMPMPSTPAPKSQIHPISPDISTRRINDTCYNCQQKGHWMQDCPNSPSNATKKPFPHSNSPNNNNNHGSPLNPPPTTVYCRCGHGPCLVKTSRSAKNPNRLYYACPIKRGKPCNGWGFVKFCDDPAIHESYMRPPPYKYPQCKCGAGVCEKVVKNTVKPYFSCPVAESHGTCGYRLSVDKWLDDQIIIPIQNSCQKRNDLGEGGDLPVENSKRMRTMGNFESPLSPAVSELPERDDAAAPQTAPSTPDGFPEFDDADDLEEVVNSVPWDDVEKEALVLSSWSASPKISCRQNLFPDDSIAGALTDASFGHYLVGWLGRLLFIHPTQGLKFPTPQPFFCCIFPSFDLIVVPKQVVTYECKQLALSNLSQPSQLSRDVVGHTEVSGDSVSLSPIMSQGSPQRRLRSKDERKKQLALIAKQQLLEDLESLDPRAYESMKGCAEDTFAVLDGLSVDYQHFYELIWDFINCASAAANINKSMENSLSVEECNRRVEEERARFAQIQEDCVKTKALLKASNEKRQWLREEVSHLEAVLIEKRNQLNSCELESLKIETDHGDLKRRMVEADTTLKGRAEEAELAKTLDKERKTKQMAAKAALEKAKLELEN